MTSLSEEFLWRSFASMVWTMLILPFSLMFFVVAANFSLWSPILWILNSLSTICTLSTLGLCVLLQTFSILSTSAHKRAVNIYKLRSGDGAKKIMFLLRPSQLLTIIYFAIFCMVFTASFVGFLAPFSNLNSDSLVFLACYSIFMGVFYGVEFYTGEHYKLCFPVIQQKKLFRLKKVVVPSLKGSFFFSLKAMKVYLPIFFISCLVPHFLSYCLWDQEKSTSSSFSPIFRLFDVSLLWLCFLVSCLTSFVLIASNKILHVFYTQVLNFPIEATFVEEQGKTLTEVMSSNEPIIKCLGFMNYCIVSRFEGSKRATMFGLTIPGNQPHTWNKTSLQCLQVLQDQRMRISNEYERKELSKRVHVSRASLPRSVGQQELFSPDGALGTTSVVSPFTKTTTSSDSVHVTSPPTVHEVSKGQEANVPIFQDLQVVMWAIEGLCNFIASSLHEDKYGVVQKNLPDVISELLQLLEACECFGKVSMLQNHLATMKDLKKSQQENLDATSLKLAVKAGIYVITSTFNYHVTSLRLSKEHKKKLHSFLEFDE